MRTACSTLVAMLLLAVPATAAAQEEDACTSQLTGTTEVSLAQQFLQQAEDTTKAREVRNEWYRKALEQLQGPIDDNTENPTTWYFGAVAQTQLGNYEAVSRYLDRFVELVPECQSRAEQLRYAAWAQLYNRAIQHYNANRSDSALAYFELASDVYPDARSLLNAAALREQAGEADSAMTLYQKALDAGGEPARMRQAVTSLANLRLQAGDQAGAMQLYRDYLADHPDDVLVKLNYAQALNEADRGDSARAIFSAMLDREDMTFEQLSELGVGLFRAEAYGDAATAFRKARQIRPLNKETMENLASSLVRNEEYEAAVPLSDTLVAWWPWDGGNMSIAVRAFGRTQATEKAQELLTRIQEGPFVFEQLGMIEQSTGQYRVQGIVRNKNAQEGASRTFVFEFLSESGQPVQTEEFTVELPAQESNRQFSFTVESGTPLATFRYELAGGAEAGQP